MNTRTALALLVLVASLTACGLEAGEEDLASTDQQSLSLPGGLPQPKPLPTCGGLHSVCCAWGTCNSGLKCNLGSCVPLAVGTPCPAGGNCGDGLSCVLGLCAETAVFPGPLAEPPPAPWTATAVGKAGRVLLFVNTVVAGGDPKFQELYRFFETTGSSVLHSTLDGSYDQVVELKSSVATLEAFLNQLRAFEASSTVQAIDVVFSVHGYFGDANDSGGYIYFADGGVGAHRLANLIWNRRKDACVGSSDPGCVCARERKLRILYSAACYGNAHMSALRDAGFKAVAGAVGVHTDSAASFPTFLSYWKQGWMFQEAVDMANQADRLRIYDNAAKLNPNWADANSFRFTSGNTGLQIGGADASCHPVDPSPAAILFQHGNYAGYRIELKAGRYRLQDLQALGMSNDDISSIRVSSGYRVKLYRDDFYASGVPSGPALTLTADRSDLNALGFNDTLSAIEVEQTSFVPAVSLFQHENYTGYRVDLPLGSYTLADLEARGMRNDDISSIRIFGSPRVWLFEHDGFSGAWAYLTSDQTGLNPTGWSDRISSIWIF